MQEICGINKAKLRPWTTKARWSKHHRGPGLPGSEDLFEAAYSSAELCPWRCLFQALDRSSRAAKQKQWSQVIFVTCCQSIKWRWPGCFTSARA